MKEFAINSGRIHIKIQVIEIGEDLCVIISGGDKPHIGAVSLNVKNHFSNKDDKNEINLEEHKDYLIIEPVSVRLAKKLGRTVLVTGGIHLDNIEKEEIAFVLDCIHEVVDIVVNCVESVAFNTVNKSYD